MSSEATDTVRRHKFISMQNYHNLLYREEVCKPSFREQAYALLVG